MVPAQVRERKWRRALPQRRGRAGGWPQGRGGRLPRSPHPQPPRSFSAPGTQGRRGPAPLGGARQRPRSARWLRPRDWCPASRVASPPGHDGSRRLAGSSALGLWARPLPSGPLGAVRTSARRRFAPLCLRPAQSPAHLLGSGETEMGGGGRVGATRIEAWERSAWGGGGTAAWVRTGPRGERGRPEPRNQSPPTPQPGRGTAPHRAAVGCRWRSLIPICFEKSECLLGKAPCAGLALWWRQGRPASVSPGALLLHGAPASLGPNSIASIGRNLTVSPHGRCGARMDWASSAFGEGPRAAPLRSSPGWGAQGSPQLQVRETLRRSSPWGPGAPLPPRGGPFPPAPRASGTRVCYQTPAAAQPAGEREKRAGRWGYRDPGAGPVRAEEAELGSSLGGAQRGAGAGGKAQS